MITIDIKELKENIQVAKDSLDSLDSFLVNEADDFLLDNSGEITKQLQEMEKQADKLQSAYDFINYNVKEGIYDEDQFENMTPEQLIEFADKEDTRATMAYEAQKEEGLE